LSSNYGFEPENLHPSPKWAISAGFESAKKCRKYCTAPRGRNFAGMQGEGAVARNMHIRKNTLVWESLTFRHSGRPFEPESSLIK
jgi:hypothetical protein